MLILLRATVTVRARPSFLGFQLNSIYLVVFTQLKPGYILFILTTVVFTSCSFIYFTQFVLSCFTLFIYLLILSIKKQFQTFNLLQQFIILSLIIWSLFYCLQCPLSEIYRRQHFLISAKPVVIALFYLLLFIYLLLLTFCFIYCVLSS